MILHLKIKATREKIFKAFLQRFSALLRTEHALKTELKFDTKFTIPAQILNNEKPFVQMDYAPKVVKEMHQKKLYMFTALQMYSTA